MEKPFSKVLGHSEITVASSYGYWRVNLPLQKLGTDPHTLVGAGHLF